MPAEVPPNATRYVLQEYERFPTLSVDDGMWRGENPGDEPAGHYPDERTVILSDTVYELWTKASEGLRAIEDMILEIEAQQLRFEHLAPPPRPAEPEPA